jgi:PKD repeat protein
MLQRIQLVLSLITCFLCNTVSAQVTPAAIPDLALWLAADTGVTTVGGAVSQWDDISGNGHNAVQTVAACRPLLQAGTGNNNNLINYKPMLRFDGSNDSLIGVTIPGINSSSVTVFVLAQGDNMAAAERGMFSINKFNNGFWFERGTSTQSLALWNNNSIVRQNNTLPNAGFIFKVLEVRKTLGTTTELFINNTAAGSSTVAAATGAFTNANYVIGKSISSWLGEIAEVIVYTRALTASERQQVQTYLYNKYAPPVVLGPDVNQVTSVCPVVLNTGSRFVTYAWSTGATTPTLSVTQSGTYSVTVTDVFGRTSSDTVSVTMPVLMLNSPDTSICAGQTINLATTLQSPGSFTYSWSNGATTPSVAAGTEGFYSITVTDTTAGSCTASSNTIFLNMDSFTYTATLGPDVSICSGNSVSLQNPASGFGGFQFQWTGGGTDSTLVIQTAGAYSVTVTNTAGCVAIDTINVSIFGTTPNVSFTGDSVCVGLAFTPQNNTTPNTGNTYDWNFGNGGSSTLPNPVYVYSTPGNYPVTLTATTTQGCVNSFSKTILVKPSPVVNFNADTGCINADYQFIDSSTVTGGLSISQWSWNFGDGSPFSPLQNPAHAYTATGNKSVSLTVTSSNGCTTSANKNLVVVGSASAPQSFALTSPANGSQITTSNVGFSWNASANAKRYTLLLSTDANFSTAQVYSNLSTNSYTATLTPNTQYYWKVRAYNVCNDSVSSATFNFRIFSPANLSGLQLWLMADSGVTLTAGKVSLWKDVSGNGQDANQNTAANRPTLDTSVGVLNFKPALKFDGTTPRLDGTTIPGINNSSLTIFVLAQGDNMAPNERGMFGINSNTNGFWFDRGTSTQSLTVWNNNVVVRQNNTLPNTGFNFKILEARKTLASATELFINSAPAGSSTAAGAIGPFTNNNYVIGRTVASWLGNIAEVLVYNRALTNAEIQAVEGYMYNKYAPPVNLGPDIVQTYSMCPVILNAQNRFVSYLWSTGETTPQINARTSGTYWVRTIDVFDRISSDTVNVVVPYAGMNTADTTICSYNNITLLPQLNSSPYSFSWNTGASTQSITVNNPGEYLVSIIDTNGCIFVGDTVRMAIDSIAFENLITVTDTTICSGNELALNPINYPSPVVLWSNGADSTQIPFDTQGQYWVQVTDANGCLVRDTIDVNISWIAPLIGFSATTVCYGDTTQFTDITQNVPPDNIKTWQWVFGDGYTSTQQSPAHYYFAPGDYNVTLSIVTDSGCTGFLSKIVTSSLPPIPGFTYPEVICAGTPILLADQSAFLFGDSVTAWIWSVNGAVSSTAKNFTYEFPAQGSYEITLQAISKSGCSDSITQTLDVFPTLKADFAYSGVCFGDSTAFTDLTGSLSIVDWQWTLGYSISAVETEQNPKHKYVVPGDYTVTLRVENAIGCVDYETKTVSIVQRPNAKFGNLIACEDQPYTPLDSSVVNNDTIAAWKWIMAGNNYNGQAPMHIFPDSGSYPVKLKVTTQKGCSDSVTRTVAVKPTPKALFTVTPLYGEAPVEISFINQSTGASSYLWNFGDANISTDAAPFHTYTANDTFNITLTATSAFGCMDSSSRTFIVAPTDLDIAVDKVTVTKKPQPDGSYLINVVADVSNVGTRLITNTLFYVTIGSGGVIAEEWDSVILSGYNAQIMFKAEFVVAAENANSYVCVKAVSVNNGETETRTDNNSQCASTEQTIQVIGPSPNPMSSNASVGIIVPKAGTVTIDIMDMAGQYVVKGEQVNVPKGRSEWQLPADKMRSAEYFLRLYYNDDIIVRKFIVAKQ